MTKHVSVLHKGGEGVILKQKVAVPKIRLLVFKKLILHLCKNCDVGRLLIKAYTLSSL